jgi:hypothetical protein
MQPSDNSKESDRPPLRHQQPNNMQSKQPQFYNNNYNNSYVQPHNHSNNTYNQYDQINHLQGRLQSATLNQHNYNSQHTQFHVPTPVDFSQRRSLPLPKDDDLSISENAGDLLVTYHGNPGDSSIPVNSELFAVRRNSNTSVHTDPGPRPARGEHTADIGNDLSRQQEMLDYEQIEDYYNYSPVDNFRANVSPTDNFRPYSNPADNFRPNLNNNIRPNNYPDNFRPNYRPPNNFRAGPVGNFRSNSNPANNFRENPNYIDNVRPNSSPAENFRSNSNHANSFGPINSGTGNFRENTNHNDNFGVPTSPGNYGII